MRLLLAIFASVLLTACTSTQVASLYRSYFDDQERTRDIFITIDGTGNSQISRTNAARLFEIIDAGSVSPAGRELATYYGEGVGSEGEILGLAAGMGMSEDIRNAYAFLTRTYRPGDRIVLSGFSRGAYAARALNGLIAVAGIPDLSSVTPNERKRIVKRVFSAYRNTPRRNWDIPERFDKRLERVLKVYRDEGVVIPAVDHGTKVKALAIWDTVEAMGWPDYSQDPDERDRHYYLTNCNVDHVFHALALDDNRAYSFTPIFAQGAKNYALCPEKETGAHVEEVWFAGAHADVGGTYAPDDQLEGHLPGISLNWMLERMVHVGLLPEGIAVFADENGPIHDAKGYSKAYTFLSEHFRYPKRYHEKVGLAHINPKFHSSAIARLENALAIDANFAHCRIARIPRKESAILCGYQLEQIGPVAELIERNCMKKTKTGYALIKNQPCIEVVD